MVIFVIIFVVNRRYRNNASYIRKAGCEVGQLADVASLGGYNQLALLLCMYFEAGHRIDALSHPTPVLRSSVYDVTCNVILVVSHRRAPAKHFPDKQQYMPHNRYSYRD